MQALQAFYDQLTIPRKVVITTHQKPDGDAMGSSLGLYHFLIQLGHTVTVISPTNWAGFLKWMPGCKGVIDFDYDREKALGALNEAELLFCLDFNVLHRTKNMEPYLAALECTRILIDHHEQPQQGVFHYGISDTSKSSTAEMVYDFIVDSGYADLIDVPIAECLYTGVMTDTGSFRFPAASASVHKMVAVLKSTGFRHTQVHENIYDNFLENRVRFTGFVLLNRMEVFYEYNTALMAISKQDLLRFHIKTGDTEGLVNYLLTIQGMKLAALVIDRDEERKWSFRSKGNFDANTFARTHFEGGGHYNAAGGRSSESLDQTVRKFKQVIKEYAIQLQ
ncbi:bifunctional oligoribonuclease/PAP phosphatase NrnA [Segetibacter sp. 3557_3]|uniref:DHH family phosphoesterase n=1 Tax=Segetibacter sp. 3557_3 TaxID=2547429 RepID=UPI001058BE78|nr:DHH family phosphoesterase [Segetibacter sp. 3557_3]TDH29189.1 bifunctional oligoribonuclease/PAP phosphatase NrnA [Segetibacter sp. 3557_3]